MSAITDALDELQAKVQKITDVAEAMRVYLKNLAAQLIDNANAPAIIKEIGTKLDAEADAIAGDLVANTKADPKK